MAWIQKLYETYENCRGAIGHETDENKVPLLPICHTTQKAHVEIVIDGEGYFKRARVIPKGESRTVIPCTESSGGRTSGRVAHPLCDKLQYVAQDYVNYCGSEKASFDLYVAELEKWLSSDYSHPKVEAVSKYVNRETVIHDLINYQILLMGRDGKLMKKLEYEKEKDALAIFDVVNTQEEAFIRWIVEIPGDRESRVWKDTTVWEKWIKFYSERKESKTLCFVTGRDEYSADQHPAKIRNDGDKAKLISSNDQSGFTFRGRFLVAEQACSVGFEVTQKAHSALRWLISRQGYRRDDQAIVAWAISGKVVPQPLADPLAILGFDELLGEEASFAYTAENVALRFRNKIAGYGSDLGKTEGVVVMALDSATLGRMAITFYRELTGSEYIERIDKWHDTCTWFHQYRFVEVQEDGKSKSKSIPFVGAPSPSDIAEAAYATNNNGKFQLDDKLRKTTVERILPCIIDGQPIPRDIVESAIRRASNRVALADWQWEKILSIACALFKKLKEKENYSMALDPNRNTRDYLYGRLLAIADRIEGRALGLSKEKRDTNAARYMQQFAVRPYKTWMQIELALAPYLARLGGRAKNLKNLLDEVMSMFDPIGEFKNDKPLSGEFLLGYHCQREKLKPKGKGVVDEQDEEPVEQEEI